MLDADEGAAKREREARPWRRGRPRQEEADLSVQLPVQARPTILFFLENPSGSFFCGGWSCGACGAVDLVELWTCGQFFLERPARLDRDRLIGLTILFSSFFFLQNPTGSSSVEDGAVELWSCGAVELWTKNLERPARLDRDRLVGLIGLIG